MFCFCFVFLGKSWRNEFDEYNEALSWRRDPVGPVGFPRTTSTSGSPRGRIGIRYTIKSTIAKILRWFWLLCFYSSRRDFNLRQLRLRGFFIRKKKSHFGFFFSFSNKKKCFFGFHVVCFSSIETINQGYFWKKFERKTEKVATLRHTYL